MRNHVTISEGGPTGLPEHPAVKAWGKLCRTQVEPRRIVTLKPEEKTSWVYRLEDLGPSPSVVIAKRKRMASIAIEVAIYREILPHMPLRTLQCYGVVQDQDPLFGWLFMEDAGDERYSLDNGEHRALAAQWLGILHTSGVADAAAKACLPNRGLDHWHKIVLLACDIVRRSLVNPAFSIDDSAILNTILSQGQLLLDHWSQVEEICEIMPQTLVHGDFSPKNVRIRAASHGLELFPIDWDCGGWGMAAADLSQTDIAVYWSVVQHRRPGLDRHAVARFANVGRTLWALEPITGEADSLASDWVGNVMRKMRFYEGEIASAIQASGWADSSVKDV